MALDVQFTPWYRIDDGRYINLSKLTDVVFYDEGSVSDSYAICRLENGSQCRVSGEEAEGLKLILENCSAINLLNAVEYKGLVEVHLGMLHQIKSEIDDEEEEEEDSRTGAPF